jgi:hypothetical protein
MFNFLTEKNPSADTRTIGVPLSVRVLPLGKGMETETEQAGRKCPVNCPLDSDQRDEGGISPEEEQTANPVKTTGYFGVKRGVF